MNPIQKISDWRRARSANRAARKAARKARRDRIRTSMRQPPTPSDPEQVDRLSRAVNADDTDLHDQ